MDAIAHWLKHLRSGLLGTGILILLSPLLLELSMRFWLGLLPKVQDTAASSILILGRGVDSQRQRALVGAQLWNEARSQSIFVSGMTDAPEIMKTLKQVGVPEARVRGERCSKTTWENGLFSQILLRAQAGNRIVLVTDELHMVRAFLVFRGFDFDVTTHPIAHESTPLFSLKRWRILLREHVALLAYAARGKLQASLKGDNLATALAA
ncbi:MAG: YdcF family protein [Leptolyngbyaceae cyanobacterium]